MFKIVAKVPHDVVIYGKDSVIWDADIRKYRLKDGATPALTVASAGMLSVKIDMEDISKDTVPFPQWTRAITGDSLDAVIDELNKLSIAGADAVIVSAQLATALEAHSLDYPLPVVLYTVGPVIVDDSSRPVGCLGLTLCR